WEGFRVHSGSIERISLSIPWTRLYTGKVRAFIKCLRLEVESLAESAHGKSEAELIKEMRDAKEKAIDVRMQQLQDLVDRSKDSDDENAVSDNASLGMNLARKILNNITVVLEDSYLLRWISGSFVPDWDFEYSQFMPRQLRLIRIYLSLAPVTFPGQQRDHT
ncbi:unnamed protein product, partial [Symbiodinium sp. KB8]